MSSFLQSQLKVFFTCVPKSLWYFEVREAGYSIGQWYKKITGKFCWKLHGFPKEIVVLRKLEKHTITYVGACWSINFSNIFGLFKGRHNCSFLFQWVHTLAYVNYWNSGPLVTLRNRDIFWNMYIVNIYSVRTRIFHYRTNVTCTIIVESLWIYKLL